MKKARAHRDMGPGKLSGTVDRFKGITVTSFPEATNDEFSVILDSSL